MLNPKVLKGYLDNNLLKEIVEEYKKDIELNPDIELVQISLFIGFVEVEDWLEYYYEIKKNGNCYELTIDGLKIIILRVASYEENYISVFPFYFKTHK